MRYRILAVFLLVAVGLAASPRHLRAEGNLIERFDFVEADLRDILRSIGMAGKITVLLTKEVTGTYSLYIREPMAIRDALERVARTYEYDLRWLNPEKTVVVIGRSETLRQNFDLTMTQTRVFPLRYSTVTEIAEALKLVVEQAKMSLNPRTNQIAITASPLQLENAAEIIAQMDHPMPQVNIEARMEEIVESSMEELGLVWGASYSLTFGPGFSIFPAEVLSAKLNVLHTQNKAVTLAQPNATCLDSQQATIFIGDKYPVARLQIVEGKESWTVDYADIGTKLVIKPRVNKENIVTVYVTAEVSSILEYVETPAGKFPVIRSRSTESLARLKDGQTFVLTGLVRRDDKTDQTGIPILDRLPILSALFKNKRAESRSTVICLFLTPRIQPVTEEELIGGTVRDVAPAPIAPEGADKGKKDEPGPKKKELQEGGTVIPPAAPSPSPPPPPATSGAPETEGASAPASPAPGAPEAAKTEAQAAPTPRPEASLEAAPAPPEGLAAPAAPIPEFQEREEAPPPEAAGEAGAAPAVPSAEEIVLPSGETAVPLTPLPPAEAPEPVEPRPPAIGPAVPMRPEDLKEVAYTVRKGETFFAIAKKFGLAVKEIAEYNGLKSSSTIYPGQILRIPIPDSHKYVVKPKETLWRIAKRYGTTVDLLVEINGLADPTRLEVGQVLILPRAVSQVVNPDF